MAWDARAFSSTLHLSFWEHLCFFVTTHYFQIFLCSAEFWHLCYELLLVVVAVPIGASVYECLEFCCANVLQHMWGESTLIIALFPAALHLWIWDGMSMKRQMHCTAELNYCTNCKSPNRQWNTTRDRFCRFGSWPDASVIRLQRDLRMHAAKGQWPKEGGSRVRHSGQGTVYGISQQRPNCSSQ